MEISGILPVVQLFVFKSFIQIKFGNHHAIRELIGLGPSRISTSIEGLFWKVVNNDFNGISWADRVTVAAHIAFGVVDYKKI
jgi:hypothetical protein